jgi:hypothetical protein
VSGTVAAATAGIAALFLAAGPRPSPVQFAAGGYGFALVLLNGLAAWGINRAAAGAAPTRFFAWALLGHGARAGLLLLALIAARVLRMAEFEVFLAVALCGYFAFLFAEILGLHFRGSAGSFAHSDSGG